MHSEWLHLLAQTMYGIDVLVNRCAIKRPRAPTPSNGMSCKTGEWWRWIKEQALAALHRRCLCRSGINLTTV